ncbi:MAG: GtrA family protein [Pseudomonadota bacterium]
MGSQGRTLVAELLRFHLVGVGTLLVGTAVFLGMVAAGFGYVPALVGDYAAGIVFSYFMNKKFTFRVKVKNDVVPLLVTVLTYVVTFSLNVLLLSVAVEIYTFNVVYAQVVIMLLLAIMNFLLLKFLVFGVFDSRKGRDKTSVQEG